MTVTRATYRKADAKNRGLRALLVNLAIDLLLAIVLVVWTTFDNANSWGDIEWAILGFSVCKSAVAAFGAFLLRAVLDPSRIPTPLPPVNPGRPADPVG